MGPSRRSTLKRKAAAAATTSTLPLSQPQLSDWWLQFARMCHGDISQNHFTGPLLKNLTNDLTSFNESYNDLSGVIPENLRKFPESSFFPGNSNLQFPNPPAESNDHGSSSKKKSIKTIFKVLIIVACVIAVVILILLAIFIHYMRISRRPLPEEVGTKDVRRRPTAVGSGGRTVVSAGDIATSRKGSSSDIITSEKIGSGAVASFSPSKHSGFSYSPDSGDSYTVENLSRLDVRSPDRLAGELYFLDDTVSFSPEELSRAPAMVLGRSSHGTSYRATLDNGLFVNCQMPEPEFRPPMSEVVETLVRIFNGEDDE
ncbi:Leucine-rich repeat-containing protein [Artemisia annua]|uniref:Leucine-rich repeat-containing protein n=1 Tax=Artemisia annua TaxID=35608 RepID=A0A2U1PXC4_ARTAN|nr:Leucine-rich repeat-containing protein [Artemisia annua]